MTVPGVVRDKADVASVLAGVTVLDLSRVLAGPLCAQMLADHGARVVKVEAPHGDDTRAWGPPFDAEGQSAYYRGLNRNKDNIVLDLRTAAGRSVLERLLAESDVVVENFKPGTMEAWGFDQARLERDFPRLVHCQVSGYGSPGPMAGMPGYDAVLQAYSGLMSVNGYPDRGPLRIGVPIVDIGTANLAFSGILLALLEREASGLGQLVDISLLDTAVSMLHPFSASWAVDGKPSARTGSAHAMIAPYDVFRARDGYLFVSAANDRQFRDLVEVLGRAELAEDVRFLTNLDRVTHLPELAQVLGQEIGRIDRHELSVELTARGVPSSPVHDVAEALSDPQIRARGLVVSDGDYTGVGTPIKLGRSRPATTRRPARQGESTRAVLATLGVHDKERAELERQGAFGPFDKEETR
jgi:crotonobetainyl-CoA:carnitine CoA-transferase CaiB-like acyl-CoA transferase